MKVFKGLAIGLCIVLVSVILYNNTHYNYEKYDVLEIFALPYGGEETIWLDENCLLFKDDKVIADTLGDTNGKEIVISQKGVYKVAEIKK